MAEVFAEFAFEALEFDETDVEFVVGGDTYDLSETEFEELSRALAHENIVHAKTNNKNRTRFFID